MKTQLLIPAAGMGTRLGSQGPKALVELAGQPLLVRTLARFESLGLIDGAVITAPGGAEDAFQSILALAYPAARFSVVPGGEERQHSVDNGLAALDADTQIVVIHDAARPFVPPEAIQASIDAAAEFGAATVAIPSADTILVSNAEQFLEATPDRKTLWACQTPQTFRVDVIRDAHARAKREGWQTTDDATVVLNAGGKPKLVMGSPLNFKVTTPGDLSLARAVIREGLV